MTMGIPVPDLPVTAMDHQFRVLVLRNLASFADRVTLMLMDGGRAGVALTLYGPAALVGHDVLILAGH